MAYELYHCVGARSFRALWALEALGLTYQLRVLPFPPRVHARDFLAINPLGTVPALIGRDEEGMPWLMTESAAICELLAARHDAHGLAVCASESDYPRYLNGLHFAEATLTMPLSLVLRYGRFEPEARRSPQVVEDYRRWFLARLRGLEHGLSGRAWYAAGRFTAADIALGYALKLAALLGLQSEFSPEVSRYWQALQARDDYQSALKKEAAAVAAAGLDGAALGDLPPA